MQSLQSNLKWPELQYLPDHSVPSQLPAGDSTDKTITTARCLPDPQHVCCYGETFQVNIVSELTYRDDRKIVQIEEFWCFLLLLEWLCWVSPGGDILPVLHPPPVLWGRRRWPPSTSRIPHLFPLLLLLKLFSQITYRSDLVEPSCEETKNILI